MQGNHGSLRHKVYLKCKGMAINVADLRVRSKEEKKKKQVVVGNTTKCGELAEEGRKGGRCDA